MARPREPLDLMDSLDERGGAKGAREEHHGVRGGRPSVRQVVRVAQRVLRPELWGSYEVTMSADSVSVRVHRVQGATRTVNVPNPRVSSDAQEKASPSTPTKWKDMSKKERRSIQAQRRGILNRFARTGVLADSHPARRWVRLAKAAAAAASAATVSTSMHGIDGHGRQKGTTAPGEWTKATSERGGTSWTAPPDQRIDLTEFGEAEGKEILLSLMCPSLSTFSPPDGPIRAPSSPPTKRPCREKSGGRGGIP